MKTIRFSERLSFFQRVFPRGQPDCYGTYFRDTGRHMVRKEPTTDEIIASHLAGKMRLGVFPLAGTQI